MPISASIPLIDTLLKLIDKGIDLLRENERQRKLFFEEVVKPLAAVFEELYSGHIATFKQTREMILEGQPSDVIADFVQTRILFEQQTTGLLRHLTDLDAEDDWRKAPSGNALNAAFKAYAASIARCLVSPEYQIRPSVAYYLALHDLVKHLSGKASAGNVRELDKIVSRFQDFYTEVRAQYARLLRYASA